MMELIGSDDLLTSYQIFDLIGYQDQGRIMKPSFELFQREFKKNFGFGAEADNFLNV